MTVNIDIKDSFVFLEEFQDSQNAVINIAKTGSFLFLGMMKPTRPVNGHLSLSLEDIIRSKDRTCSVGFAVIVEA